MVAGVIVLLLGASRLPKLARSVSEARRELAKARAENDDAPAPKSAPKAAAAAPVAVAEPATPPPLPPPLPPPDV